MKQPWWGWGGNPKYFFGLLLVVEVAGLSWMFGSWLARTWTPSLLDAIYGLAGVGVYSAWLIVAHVQARRHGDAYIRSFSFRAPLRLWSPGVWVFAINTIAFFSMPEKPWALRTCFGLGMGLGMMTWYWHWCAVHKRLTELYELDKTTELAPIVADAPSAPQAR